MLFSSGLIFVFTLAIAARADQTVLKGSLDSSGPKRAALQQIYQAYPEYSLDLSERRLIQFDASVPAVFLTELEKVNILPFFPSLLSWMCRSNLKLRASNFLICEGFFRTRAATC